VADWIAVCYGALDVEARDDFEGLPELLVLPVFPVANPVALSGEVASFWRRMVAGPVTDEEVTEDERYLLAEFAAFGIASCVLTHPARLREIPQPWLFSPMHELVNSLVASVARDSGVEVLFIKGPVLTRQQLRHKKHSGDVDVWVEPGKISLLEASLAEWGWSSQFVVWDGSNVTHSSAMDPGDWGCQIDIHGFFPGVGVEPEEAFVVIGEASEIVPFAGVEAHCPSRPVHAVISALHSVRPEIGKEVSADRLEKAVGVLQKAGEETLVVARTLGASAPLDAVFRTAFPEADIPDPGPLPASWVWRTKGNVFVAFFSALNGVPRRQRFGYFWRVIWPSEEAAIASEARAGSMERRPLRMRLNRLGRGARQALSRWKDQ